MLADGRLDANAHTVTNNRVELCISQTELDTNATYGVFVSDFGGMLVSYHSTITEPDRPAEMGRVLGRSTRSVNKRERRRRQAAL